MDGYSYLRSHRTSMRNIAAVYNQAGRDYVTYADGDPKRLFCFEGLHAYADRQLWLLLDKKLRDLRERGAISLSLLDAGCGPGTWLRRLVTRARQLGFAEITAHGFDVSLIQIQTARRLANDLTGLAGVHLSFEVADLLEPLPAADASVDIVLCLYSVLSHLPIEALPKVAAEIARITKGTFITTVRSVGSTPTVFVDAVEKARHFKLDHRRDRCEVEFGNGSRVTVSFHLFTAGELRNCFEPHFHIEDFLGLDIFHSRFLPDRRWNPVSVIADQCLKLALASMEETYARDPRFIERAAHLLLVANRREKAWRDIRACECLGLGAEHYEKGLGGRGPLLRTLLRANWRD
jgi:SAM-dependent methyltransferase